MKLVGNLLTAAIFSNENPSTFLTVFLLFYQRQAISSQLMLFSRPYFFSGRERFSFFFFGRLKSVKGERKKICLMEFPCRLGISRTTYYDYLHIEIQTNQRENKKKRVEYNKNGGTNGKDLFFRPPVSPPYLFVFTRTSH